MILSKQADYGIRVMLEVATQEGTRIVTTGAVADRYEIPMPFLQKTVTRLSNGGLLLSRRGSGGGLWLAQNANKITILDIVEAIEGKLLMMECTLNGGPCNELKRCAIHGFLEETARSLGERLRSVTLADLVARQQALMFTKPRRGMMIPITVE